MRFISAFVIATILLLIQRQSDCQFNYAEEFGCHDTEFRLSCKSLTANIFIFESSFCRKSSFPNNNCEYSNRPINKSCLEKNCPNRISTGNESDYFEVNFRQSINRRCSGVNYCSFVFEKDFEGAKEIGPGEVFLRYACVEDSDVTKNCGSKINASREGLVKSPGYPGYYVGELNCLWELEAPPLQRIKISFLDISLRGIGPHETNCLDRIRVYENGLNLLSVCGDVGQEKVIRSRESTLNVSFETSSFFPKRGFTFHFKAFGCPPSRSPENAYLIEKNDSYVHYRCCPGFVFPDTLTREKFLHCLNENKWNENVLDCISVTKSVRGQKNFLSNETNGNNLTFRAIKMEPIDPVKDIILPSFLMVALFIGNAIVLYVIYKQRKKLPENDKLIELQSVSSKRPEEENC